MLLLTLTLLWGSVTEAVARSEMAGAADQVICGGYGTFTLTLDANGNPVTRHPCTHCLSAAVAAVLPGTAWVAAQGVSWHSADPAPVAKPICHASPTPCPEARAPPFAV